MEGVIELGTVLTMMNIELSVDPILMPQHSEKGRVNIWPTQKRLPLLKYSSSTNCLTMPALQRQPIFSRMKVKDGNICRRVPRVFAPPEIFRSLEFINSSSHRQIQHWTIQTTNPTFVAQRQSAPTSMPPFPATSCRCKNLLFGCGAFNTPP